MRGEEEAEGGAHQEPRTNHQRPTDKKIVKKKIRAIMRQQQITIEEETIDSQEKDRIEYVMTVKHINAISATSPNMKTVDSTVNKSALDPL